MNSTQNLDRDTIKTVSEIAYLQMRDDIIDILSQKAKGEFTISCEVNGWTRGIGKTIGLLRVAKEINAIVFNNVDKISLMETYQSLGFGELPELGVLKNREVLNKNYEIALVDEGICRIETIYNIIKLMYPVVIRIDNSDLIEYVKGENWFIL